MREGTKNENGGGQKGFLETWGFANRKLGASDQELRTLLPPGTKKRERRTSLRPAGESSFFLYWIGTYLREFKDCGEAKKNLVSVKISTRCVVGGKGKRKENGEVFTKLKYESKSPAWRKCQLKEKTRHLYCRGGERKKAFEAQRSSRGLINTDAHSYENASGPTKKEWEKGLVHNDPCRGRKDVRKRRRLQGARKLARAQRVQPSDIETAQVIITRSCWNIHHHKRPSKAYVQ